MMLVGATSLGWKHAPLEEVFVELAELGGGCIELNSRPGQHARVTIEGHELHRVRRLSHDTGVQVTSVAGYNNFAAPADSLEAELELLLFACRMAADLGVPVVRAFAGDNGPDVSLAECWPRIVASFREVAAKAKPLGVTLAIENHGYLVNDGKRLARLVRDVGADNVGITMDTGNFSWAGHDHDETWQDFEAVLPHVVNVHVKDVSWRDGEARFVPAGAGELGVSRIIERLTARGYAGPLISEYEGPPPHVDGTRESIRFLRDVRAAETDRRSGT